MDLLGSSHERHTSDRSGTGQLLPSATPRPWEARNGSDRSHPLTADCAATTTAGAETGTGEENV